MTIPDLAGQLCNETNWANFHINNLRQTRLRNIGAMYLCTICPVQKACLAEQIRNPPTSATITIAGGLLWQDGRPRTMTAALADALRRYSLTQRLKELT